MINGTFLVIIVGAWLAYRVACWCGEPAPQQTTNHEIRRQG